MTEFHKKFHSFLAPLLCQYLNFRHKLGYVVTNKATLYAFREFDQYVCFRDLSRLDQIDDTFAANWMFSISKQSAKTKNMRLVLLRGFCHYLIRLGLLKDNPTQRVPLLRTKPAPRPHIYSLQELTLILREADRWKHRWNHHFPGWVMGMFIYLVYACGLRLSEALNIKLKDIDFQENSLSLWNTKFHKERWIPFSRQTAARLKQYLSVRSQRYPRQTGPEDYLFCHKKGRYSSVGVFYLFRHLLRRAGLAKNKGPRIHDLRHTFAVHRLYKWYQQGHDPMNKLPWLTTYMGHRSVENTQVYLTITQALLREGNKRFLDYSGSFPQRALRRFRNKRL